MNIRPIRIDGDVAFIPLTQGYEAVVDLASLPLVQGRNWRAEVRRRKDGTVRTVYAVREDCLGAGKSRTVLMHRLIAATPDGFETDHRDGDGLNNRSVNLRTATKAQNMHNMRIPARNSTGFKGVCFYKPTGKWRARIKANGVETHLGFFDAPELAAYAYAKASERLHGQYSNIIHVREVLE